MTKKILKCMLLVKAANKESFATELEKITNFYADDFKPNALETTKNASFHSSSRRQQRRNLQRCPQTRERTTKRTETLDQ